MIGDYKFRTELHAHTNPASSCSDIPAKRLVELYADCGYDTLCITNHFIPSSTNLTKDKYIEYYMSDYYTAKKHGEKLGINVIFGAEYRLAENCNDYLIYGIDENDLEELFDLSGLNIDEFYSKFKNDRRVILQAHPFRNGIAQTLSVDGYEVFNMHPHHNQRTPFTAKLASDKDMLVTCGSDCHHFGTEGCIAMLTKTNPKDSFDLAAIIKSRDYLFELGGSIILPYPDMKV